jgi:hypothetical protein
LSNLLEPMRDMTFSLSGRGERRRAILRLCPGTHSLTD